MLKPRWLLSALMVGVASVQAWDSHVLQAEAHAQIMAAVGILLPALAVLLTSDTRVRCGAVVAAFGLMVLARLTSRVPMPELELSAFFPAVVVLLDHVRGLRVRWASARDGRSASL